MSAESVYPIHAQDRSDDLAVEQRLSLAFAPLHKRAFGAAIGAAFAVTVIVATLVHVITQPEVAPDLSLLRHYFYGYDVSVMGALVGGFWAFVAGFIGGWFLAFCRNFVIAVSVFLTRARAELQATRDFLDHI